jgi:fatty acid-binding protein DegV
LGSKLRINPIMSLSHGRVRVLGVVRTRRKAEEKMIEMMQERVGQRPVHASVFHGDLLEEAQRLGEQIQSLFDCVEFYITEFAPVMGAHTGPGVVGLAFYADETDETLATNSGGGNRRLGFLPGGLSFLAL